MSVLVIAVHDNNELKPATLHAVTAAAEIAEKAGSDVHILVAGKDCRAVAEAAAQIAGIAKILFYIFLALFLIALIAGLAAGRKISS